jgi:hypothetical protein
MIKKIALLIVLMCLSYQAMSCECFTVSLEKEVGRSTKVFAGKLIGQQDQTYTFLILKSWKGLGKTDTVQLTLPQENGCYRYTPEALDYYVIFAEEAGIFNCSSSGFYDDSRIVDMLDELLSTEVWVNKKYEEDLNRIEYDRKYVLQTTEEQLDTKGKDIILISEKNNVSELKMPMPLHEFGLQLIVLATKADLAAYPSPPDFIIYVPYRSEVISVQRNQKIIKRTMRSLNKTHNDL